MNTITIEIPEILSEFDESTRQELVLGALRKVTKEKLQDEISQKEEAFEQVQKFKIKYGCDFTEFEHNLPPDANYQLHEDWIQWSFWEDVLQKLEKSLRIYNRLRGSLNEDE